MMLMFRTTLIEAEKTREVERKRKGGKEDGVEGDDGGRRKQKLVEGGFTPAQSRMWQRQSRIAQ
jgi:hypothetical protein